MGGSNGAFDIGNVQVAAPYFIPARSGVILAGMAAGVDMYSLVNLGMADPRTPGALVPTPIRISQLRVKFASVTAFTAGGFALEAYRTTVTAQHGTGGVQKTAQKRKTSGYPAIAATEVNAYIVDTAATGITGGTISVVGDPLDVAVGTGTLPAIEGGWVPFDLCGHTLEQGEGILIRNGIAMAAGTGRLYVVADFLR